MIIHKQELEAINRIRAMSDDDLADWMREVRLSLRSSSGALLNSISMMKKINKFFQGNNTQLEDILIALKEAQKNIRAVDRL